ncbi:MAG: RidA family protein [Desulfovibrio sp.]
MEYVATDKAPAAIGPYSQAIEHNGLVYVSGQLGMRPADGEMVDGFEAQTRQALENMKAILEESGSSLEQVISVDVFMTDLGNFLDFNAIYAEYFSTHKPARAAIEVCALPKGGVVEMKCIAAK